MSARFAGLEEARGWYWDGDRSRMFHAMDPDTLARSLHTVIEVHTKGADVPLGASKYKGLPHLPKSVR